MAWIKWTVGLPNKPEVLRIAGTLGLAREVVACRLMRLWEWADQNIPADAIGKDGTAVIVLSPSSDDNLVFVDDVVGVKGFARAMVGAGWLRVVEGALALPNFGRHNGDTAKTRARNTKNQQRMRDETRNESSVVSPAGGDITVTPPSPAGGDIVCTRGEESINTPLTPQKGEGETVGSKPKKPRKAKADSEADPRFLKFWSAYPRKKKMPLAAAAFARANPDEPTLTRMLDTIADEIRSGNWSIDRMRFIPYPASWLNGREWEDPSAAVVPIPPPDAAEAARRAAAKAEVDTPAPPLWRPAKTEVVR